MQKEFVSGYAPVNGIEMYYEIHGSGELPLVLIHGGGSTIETSFGHSIPLFAKNNKVIAVELQAHGRTSNRDSPSSFEQDADDVAGLLDHLKFSRANFLGFSNGGNTAMQIAMRHPGLVNKLVVASSFYKREGMIPGFFEGMKGASLDNMPEQLKTAYLQVAPDKNGLQAMFNNDKQRMLRFSDWDDEAVSLIKSPTLIISGDQDVITPEHTVAMFRTLPNAKLAILPGLHGAYIGEITVAKEGSKIVDLTIAMIEEFLDDTI